MRLPISLLCTLLLVPRMPAAPQAAQVFDKGEGIPLDKVIPANERGIVCLALDSQGLFPEVTVCNVALAAPPSMPVQDIHAGVFGKDGRFYYPLNTTGPLAAGAKPEAHLRIMRFDPATGMTETVGVPDTSGVDEAKVKHVYTREAKYKLQYMQGAAVGADGSLYLMAITRSSTWPISRG